jgi:hypothetical protein
MLSKPQGLVRPEGLGKFKNSPHRESNPRPSGLQHSALTTTLSRTSQNCDSYINIPSSQTYSVNLLDS